MNYIYLHGFASRPASRKATYFQHRFAAAGHQLQIPALDGGDFQNLTVSGQLAIVDACVAGQPSVLLGSSLGGYLAALYAARHPEVQRAVLLAPAFCFPRRWQDDLGAEAFEAWRREGSREVFHYGEGRTLRIGFGLIDDAQQYEDYPVVSQPVLLLHGIQDAVVPVHYAREFARRHPDSAQLLELDTDHEMGDVLDALWTAASKFLFP
ncbi:MAG: alpha/beta hydrolase [Bryobacterales bacterium]|jgi:hypothetical protein|nr:alpha/beta hydrolase [Bryobacterales bacterium]